ncbi:protein kinase domain-containing protein [Effusibacillus pohliae]|uniref:protein kinase domain-containing protein n=1 Tax=Effusibacillus pohliae TaxID=232270 RepID=UPI000361CC85|nr:serine/threonine-protein kinase [Effusibacillus pohliae]
MAAPAATLFKIKGRWNGRSYKMVRPLGSGANGQVYLVQENGRKYALKLSTDATGIALEYRLLKQLQTQLQYTASRSVQGLRLGPFVSDLDDCVTDSGQPVFFYAMEYIPGIPASVYVREKGPSAVCGILLQLLAFLQQLHDMGYAFGDLKAENVLVNPITGEVRLVDFGGVSRFGEAIRQYTEWYDRASWNVGSRRADRQYDLFAAAMLIVDLLQPNGKNKLASATGQKDWGTVRRLLSGHPFARCWLPVVEKAWRGGFHSADEMRRAAVRVKAAETGGAWRKRASRFYKKIDRELEREWDWSHWAAIGSVVLWMSMILRLFMIK